MTQGTSHQALVAKYLAAIEGLSDREAAELEGAPLTHERIRQLRDGAWKRLNAETARKLQAYLQREAPQRIQPASEHGHPARDAEAEAFRRVVEIVERIRGPRVVDAVVRTVAQMDPRVASDVLHALRPELEREGWWRGDHTAALRHIDVLAEALRASGDARDVIEVVEATIPRPGAGRPVKPAAGDR